MQAQYMPSTGSLSSIAVIIGVLARSKHTAQYTRWNIILLLMHRILGIPIQSIFISSVTTVVGFQHGATDGTKKRLMQRNRIADPSLFIGADLVGHILPVILTGHMMLVNAGGRALYITPRHVLDSYTWIGLYYVLVGKGFNCSKQYVRYPWRRQLYASACTPLLLWGAWNRDMRHKTWSSCVLLALSVYYTKEWYDLRDDHRKNAHYMGVHHKDEDDTSTSTDAK